jgi:hypothetical protein
MQTNTNNNNKQMNYFYDVLPRELQNYIKMHVAVQQIQRIWRGRNACSKEALYIARKYVDRSLDNTIIGVGGVPHHNINSMMPETAIEIEYCTKHANIRYYNWNIWEELIEEIKHSLWIDEFTGGPGAKYHNRVEIAKTKLEDRLISTLPFEPICK